ncbi:MAG: ATP-binding protein [bacterium]
MKKKIVIGLIIATLVFVVGGLYIIFGIERATSTLDNLITLHQVEILREHLLIQIKRVQNDLSLHNTRYAKGVDTVVAHVQNMEQIIQVCYGCHHSEEIFKKFDTLRNETAIYRETLSRVFTIRANEERMQEEEDRAFNSGEMLITQVNDMISFAKMRLDKKTESVLQQIRNLKGVLFFMIAAGPFFVGVLGYIFLRSITNPVRILLDATGRLKQGDLDHRIHGLADEFGQVADSFNEMAGSLKYQLKKIQETENRYKVLFESAGDAIFILEGDGGDAGRIISANKAAADMHGYTIQEIMGKNIKDLDTLESAMEIPGRIRRILNGEWIKAEANHRKKDGTVFPVEISAGLLEFEKHKYILAFDRDITERKRAEEMLQRTEQMMACGELTTRLAHEIKNPLAGIKLSMQVLAEESALSEEDRNVLLQVVEQVDRIEHLIRNLLNFSRPQKPQLSLINIGDVLEKTLNFFQEYSGYSYASGYIIKIKIDREYDKNLPDIMADPMQMQQIFLNLFINAADAMPGGGRLHVRTWYDEPARAIKIEISDTGKGVPEEIMGRLFHPFFTTKAKGTGLGLTITQQLVEQHHGTIHVSNRPEGGTLFEITFPVENPDQNSQKGTL